MKLSNQNIFTKTDQKILWDDHLKGFGVRIYESGKRSFIIQIRDKSKKQFKRTIGNINIVSLRQARDEAKRIMSLVHLGKDPFAKDKDIYFKNFINEYIEKVSSRTKSIKSQLNEKSLYKVYLIPYFGHLKISQISKNKIRKLMFDMESKPVMANKAHNLLSHMLNIAIEWDLVKENPLRGIKKYPEERRNVFLNFEQIEHLIKVLNKDGSLSSMAIKMMILTGARKSEVLNATFDQFDLINHYWNKPYNSTKQRKTHTVPMSDKVIEIVTLLRKKQSGKYLFANFKGQPMQDIKKKWQKIRLEINMPHLRLHDLRHSFASFMANKGIPVRLISELLGHSNIQTTLRYAHVFDKSLKKAVNLI